MDADLQKLVRKHALDNGRKYGGKPNVGAVIGKVLGERPELKAELKALSKDIKAVCDTVAKLSPEEQVKELESVAPELLEKRGPEEKALKPLPEAVKGKVVMRLAPSPSGPLHIGHAVVFPLSYLYCKEYDGKLILRIEDTNPEKIYEPAYRMIEDEMNWLAEGNVAEVVVQSGRLETYYDLGEQLIANGKAYVCTCNPDIFRDVISNKKACPCRGLEVKEQHTRWDKMFVEYEPGEAVVRMKTRVDDPNPAMRDWPAFRINRHKHPRTGDKYRVWPLMNFSVAVDDHKLGVTHTIRGKDHMDNARRQKQVADMFAWMPPVHLYTGIINFEGLQVSASETRKQIEYGQFDGWDDPRLPFVAAFRRRGFQPGAFHKFALDIGLGMNDKTVPADEFLKSLEAHNRDVVDPIAKRFFFVEGPVEIMVENAPAQEVSVPKHPSNRELGVRKLKTKGSFLLPKGELEMMKDGVYRLKDCLNARKEGGKFVFESVEFEKFDGEGTVQWLPAGAENVKVEVVMPDNSRKEGLGENGLSFLAAGDVVQFERFGFCRFDGKQGDKLVFYFAHK